MIAIEEWRSVPSLPEYEASSAGRIRRIPWEGVMPNGGVRIYGGHPWFGTWERVQRRYIMMYRGRTHRVARLICEAFHGPAPLEDLDTMHLDENSHNNRPDNLAWGTRKENLNFPKVKAYHRRVCRAKMAGLPIPA